MSSIQKQLKKLKFDRRLTAFSLKNGDLSKADLEKHLSALEDCTDRAKKITISGAPSDQNMN